MFYKEMGDGFPLVLIHGFPLDHSIWNECMISLSKKFRVIAPDLHGFGKSTDTPANSSMAGMAHSIQTLLIRMGIEQVALCGHSMGGYSALSFAEQFPASLRNLILISSHIFSDSEEIKKSRFSTMEVITKVGAKNALANMPGKLSDQPKTQQFCMNLLQKIKDRSATISLKAMAERRDAIGVWKELEDRAMVLAGDSDNFLPIGTIREMEAINPLSSVKIFEGVGHLPMLDIPNIVSAEIIEIFKE